MAAKTKRRTSKQAIAPISHGKLPSYIGYHLRQAQAAMFRDFGRIVRSTGITPGEFSLLSMIEVNPGINQISLARVYRLDKATLSLAVKSLGKRRLICSTRSPADGRYFALDLTPTGRQMLRRVTRRVETQERAMDRALRPGERQRLIDMLARITAVFS